MKILVTALLFLFLSGTYGGSIALQDEKEPPKPTLRESFKSVLHQSMLLGVDLAAHWESSEEDRKAALNKRVEIIKTSYYSLGFSLGEHLVDIYKEVHKELNETYPVYNNKVVPIFMGTVVYGLQTLRSVAEEIKPYFEKFEEHVKAHQKVFWEEVRPTVQNKLKPILDALNANLKPFIDDVRKEVANNKEHSTSPTDQNTSYAHIEEQVKQTEFYQKILMFDEEMWKNMVSQLNIFNTNA